MADGTIEFNLFNKNFDRVTRFNRGISFFDYAKPLTGFFVFIFFGVGKDAMNTYKNQNSSSYALKSLNSRKHSIGDIKLSIPGEPFSGQVKSHNFLFLDGHRTPTEQAQFDLTSGIHFNLDDILLGSPTDGFDYSSKKHYSYSSKKHDSYSSKKHNSYSSKKHNSIYQTNTHTKLSYETLEGNASALITISNSSPTITDSQIIQYDIIHSPHVVVTPSSPRNSISINNLSNGINDL
ncbi:19962_t:CDS:2 [Racocetra fulgida]|uniref:19962_t:CDS:1 n=1 Tax=Racocetra fulgida TaxID=60492 RepID=A0A9N9AX01_9GLOM|nr:19962_t:CDS:2 [Racocetra fulgida]